MKIKKFVAREGLLLVAVVAIGLAIYFGGRHLNTVYLIQHEQARLKEIGSARYALVGYTPYLQMMSAGLWCALLGYPIIALIRFIFWAIKQLRAK